MLLTGPRTAATLQAVATRSGVSVSTASRCLSGAEHVAKETQLRVLSAAQELGYHYNPHVSAVMRLTRRGLTQNYVGTIAYITSYDGSLVWRDTPTLCRHWASARARAEFHGFKIAEFALSTTGLTGRRLGEIFAARGIAGLLAAAFSKEPFDITFPWDDFAAVLVGHTMYSPHIDSVVSDHTDSIIQASRVAAARGYRRIGLAIEKYQDEITNRRWSIGYAALSTVIPGLEPIPALIPEKLTETEWLAWVAQNRVDCVLTLSTFRNVPNPMQEWFETSGRRVPDDLGLISLDLTSVHPDWAGIDQTSDQIGEAAVDLLLSKLRSGDRGVPEIPRTLQVQGQWRDGRTCRSAAQIPSATYTLLAS